MTQTNKPNDVPQPAVKSTGGSSVDVAAQTRGEDSDNGLAGLKMPAPPTDEQRPSEEARAKVAALTPDADSDDDQSDDGAAEAANEDRPANFKRRPFGSQLPKLSYPQRPGYRRYWFNDKPGRVARAKEAGYSNVMENGQPVCRVVQGGGLRAFLMEIPKRFFDEDMAAQQRQVDEIEAAIRAGDMKRTDGDNRYVPKNGINFRNE